MKHSTIIMLVFESILTFGLTVGLATLLAFWTSGGEIIFAEIFVWALFAAIAYGMPTAVVTDRYPKATQKKIQRAEITLYGLVIAFGLIWLRFQSDWTRAETVQGYSRLWGLMLGLAYGFATIRIAKWLEEQENQSESRKGTISNC